MYSLLVLASLSMCEGTSLIYQDKGINTKTKIELSPLEVICNLNDIIVLTTPVVNCENAIYHLYKPNGDLLKINISKPKSNFQFHNTSPSHKNDELNKNSNLILNHGNKDVKNNVGKRMFKILRVNNDNGKPDDNITSEENHMNGNDFMIGPLNEEDHGNWVLSVYCKDLDGEWIEMFQVISITIISPVEMNKFIVMLREGNTFNISFLYPIKNLESCELVAPATSIDKFFDRNRTELDKCGYVIKNVTKTDQGTWQVFGLGKIVYQGEVVLYVYDQDEPESTLEKIQRIAKQNQ